MKNKRGFTLIELLAVIVILAIIALIATPIILNTIEKARKNSAIDSTYGYVKAIESQNALAQLDSEKYQEITSGDVTSINSKIKVKGSKPTSGTITIEKGNVKQASFCINGYTVTYDGTKVTNTTKGCGESSNEQAQQQLTYTKYNPGDLVYFDPVSSNTCDSDHFNLDNIKIGSSTCYKWRVISVDDDNTKENITIQMDHNIVNTSRWISRSDYNDDTNYGTYGKTDKGPITALKALETATNGWTRVSGLTYSYDTSLNGTNTGMNYGTLSCNSGICTAANNQITSNLKARIITGEEIRALVMTNDTASGTLADNWKLTSSTNGEFYFSNIAYTYGTKNRVPSGQTGDNVSLAWLLENTIDCTDSGAENNAYDTNNLGYWTLSPLSDSDSSYAWCVEYSGSLIYWREVNSTHQHGIRPVITLQKSQLSTN